jgi:GNAT superfamily N-acetyltransferase
MDVHPLTPDRFADLEQLFGPNGAVSGCWCTYWRQPGKGWENRPENRGDLRLRVESERPAPGLLGYVEDVPVGWVAVAPRVEFPRILRSRNLRPAEPPDDDADSEDVWCINCFYIAPGHRRVGVAGALVGAAVDHARRGGATVVEAYPVDRRQAGSGELYTGTPGLFARSGFHEVLRRHPSRPVMRRELSS